MSGRTIGETNNPDSFMVNLLGYDIYSGNSFDYPLSGRIRLKRICLRGDKMHGLNISAYLSSTPEEPIGQRHVIAEDLNAEREWISEEIAHPPLVDRICISKASTVGAEHCTLRRMTLYKAPLQLGDGEGLAFPESASACFEPPEVRATDHIRQMNENMRRIEQMVRELQDRERQGRNGDGTGIMPHPLTVDDIMNQAREAGQRLEHALAGGSQALPAMLSSSRPNSPALGAPRNTTYVDEASQHAYRTSLHAISDFENCCVNIQGGQTTIAVHRVPIGISYLFPSPLRPLMRIQVSGGGPVDSNWKSDIKVTISLHDATRDMLKVLLFEGTLQDYENPQRFEDNHYQPSVTIPRAVSGDVITIAITSVDHTIVTPNPTGTAPSETRFRLECMRLIEMG